MSLPQNWAQQLQAIINLAMRVLGTELGIFWTKEYSYRETSFVLTFVLNKQRVHFETKVYTVILSEILYVN